MTEPNKTSRWLDLVAFLLGRFSGATREEIVNAVSGYSGDKETVRRKFERDKDELRSLGIEIETVEHRGSAGTDESTTYRLKPRQAYLPYLQLRNEPSDSPYQLDRIVITRDELEVLDRATRALMEQKDTPFAESAASARRKLAFDLPFASSSIERILALPVPENARQALTVLQEAVIDRVAVSCRYFTMSRRAEAERELEPLGLLFQWGRWYCIARASDRDEPRMFRVDRMQDTKKLATGFKVPTGFNVREFAGRTPWEFGNGPTTRAVVRFSFPEARAVINQDVGTLVREEPGAGAEIAFDLRDEDAFLRWLLAFGRRAEIVEPKGLAGSLNELRADVASLYAESAP